MGSRLVIERAVVLPLPLPAPTRSENGLFGETATTPDAVRGVPSAALGFDAVPGACAAGCVLGAGVPEFAAVVDVVPVAGGAPVLSLPNCDPGITAPAT